jgi:hypothetical protein
MTKANFLSFLSKDADAAIIALKSIREQKSKGYLLRLLLEDLVLRTDNAKLRNAAAIAMADLRVPNAEKILLQLLDDKRTKSDRGTILYALEQLHGHLPIPILRNLFLEDSFEVREQTLDVIEADERGYDSNEVEEIQRFLRCQIRTAKGDKRRTMKSALELFTSA